MSRFPSRASTWDDYAERTAELTEKAGKRGFYGSADGGGVEPTFECWLRQRGKALYDAEGKLGFDAATRPSGSRCGRDARQDGLRAGRPAGARPAQHRDEHGLARARGGRLRPLEPDRRLPGGSTRRRW